MVSSDRTKLDTNRETKERKKKQQRKKNVLTYNDKQIWVVACVEFLYIIEINLIPTVEQQGLYWLISLNVTLNQR